METQNTSILDKIKNFYENTDKTMFFGGIAIILIILFYFVNQSYNNRFNKNTSTKFYDNLSEETEDKLFTNNFIQKKYNTLLKYIGEYNLIEESNSGINSLTWMLPLDSDKFKLGYFNGLDYIRLNSYMARKKHPIPAPVFTVVGKYINVPEHLYGPIKYASPTINIELLYIPKKYNDKYEKTGIKELSLVTGSCASITISTITVNFVMDMIKKYKKPIKNISMNLHIEFRDEYDKRILNYLCGKGIVPAISWFDPTKFGESDIYVSNSSKCNIFNKNKIATQLDSIETENESEEKEFAQESESEEETIQQAIQGGEFDKSEEDSEEEYTLGGTHGSELCKDLTTKNDCESAPSALGCMWENLTGNSGKCSP